MSPLGGVQQFWGCFFFNYEIFQTDEEVQRIEKPVGFNKVSNILSLKVTKATFPPKATDQETF